MEIPERVREIDEELRKLEEKMSKIDRRLSSKLFRILAHQHAQLIAEKAEIFMNLENRKE